jgi:hypothetical protein
LVVSLSSWRVFVTIALAMEAALKTRNFVVNPADEGAV